MKGWFIRVENTKGDRITVYGPFDSERDARVKNIFYRSEAELTKTCKRSSVETYSHVGVSFYAEGELESVVADPGSCRLKSLKVRLASALRNHADWAGRDLEFLANYYLNA